MTSTTDGLRERLLEGLELTPGERLRLARRAQGQTQVRKATYHRVGLEKYRGWEEDVGDVPAVELDIDDVSLGELVLVYRHRLGLTYSRLAEKVGMERSQAHRASTGRRGVEKVVEYLLEETARRQEQSDA